MFEAEFAIVGALGKCDGAELLVFAMFEAAFAIVGALGKCDGAGLPAFAMFEAAFAIVGAVFAVEWLKANGGCGRF